MNINKLDFSTNKPSNFNPLNNTNNIVKNIIENMANYDISNIFVDNYKIFKKTLDWEYVLKIEWYNLIMYHYIIDTKTIDYFNKQDTIKRQKILESLLKLDNLNELIECLDIFENDLYDSFLNKLYNSFYDDENINKDKIIDYVNKNKNKIKSLSDLNEIECNYEIKLTILYIINMNNFLKILENNIYLKKEVEKTKNQLKENNLDSVESFLNKGTNYFIDSIGTKLALIIKIVKFIVDNNLNKINFNDTKTYYNGLFSLDIEYKYNVFQDSPKEKIVLLKSPNSSGKSLFMKSEQYAQILAQNIGYSSVKEGSFEFYDKIIGIYRDSEENLYFDDIYKHYEENTFSSWEKYGKILDEIIKNYNNEKIIIYIDEIGSSSDYESEFLLLSKFLDYFKGNPNVKIRLATHNEKVVEYCKNIDNIGIYHFKNRKIEKGYTDSGTLKAFRNFLDGKIDENIINEYMPKLKYLKSKYENHEFDEYYQDQDLINFMIETLEGGNKISKNMGNSIWSLEMEEIGNIYDELGPYIYKKEISEKMYQLGEEMYSIINNYMKGKKREYKLNSDEFCIGTVKNGNKVGFYFQNIDNLGFQYNERIDEYKLNGFKLYNERIINSWNFYSTGIPIDKKGFNPINRKYFKVENLGIESQVKNSIELTAKNPIALISGINGSGKTTFIKNIFFSIKLLLDKGETGILDKIVLGKLNDFGFMERVRGGNEYSGGISDIVNWLKLLEKADKNKFIIVSIDEVFSSMDEKHSIAFAYNFIGKLLEKGVFAIITSHNHELLKLLGELEGVKNYHFDSYINQNGEITHTYKLKEGILPMKGYGIDILKNKGIGTSWL